MPQELLLTKRRATKIRNTFAINMSTDIKLSKDQLFKIIQSSGPFASCLGNLGKKELKMSPFLQLEGIYLAK